MMTDILQTTTYDESDVPEYTLPSALKTPDGKMITTAQEWVNFQRRHVLGLFEKHMFGKLPPRPDGMRFELIRQKEDALGGLARRKEVRIHLSMQNGKTHHLDVLLYLPKNTTGPVPAFVGMNFEGNHAVTHEADISLSTRWMRDMPGAGIVDHRATEEARGHQVSRWQLEKAMKRGYAVATMYYGDVYPDSREGWEESIWMLFGDDKASCGTSISAWAWGLSRMMDYLQSDADIDSHHVAVLGHSRLGKTSLWAGANDRRFALVISNNSGCGGAALTRRRFGERIGFFPLMCVGYWFLESFYDYEGREAELPIDQHMLMSLMAPRPVYVTSATEDDWADQRGEFLSVVHAEPVYRLFGSCGLGTDVMPEADCPIHADAAYHLRTGKHNVTEADWGWFLDYADRFFGREKK